MKKLLLTLAVAAMGVSAYADEVTFDFTQPSTLSGVSSSGEALNLSDSGTENEEVSLTGATFTAGDITLLSEAPSSASSKPRLFYGSGNAAGWSYRFYANTSFTIAGKSGATITKIVFSGTNLGTNSITWSTGSFDSNTRTWIPIDDETVNTLTVAKTATGNNPTITKIVVTYTPGPADFIDSPSISFENTTNTVTLSAAEGTNIYYTTDGSEPSTVSTKYDAPFTITKTVSVKAIAELNGKTSAVASKECDYYGTFNNYADYVEANPTKGGKVNGPITVLYQTGNALFTQDQDGGYMLVFGKLNTTLNNGNILGWVAGDYSPYNGLPEITSPTIGDVTTGGAEVEPIIFTLDQLKNATNAELSTFVKIVGVTIEAASANRNYTLTDAEGNTATLYDSFNNAANIPVDDDKEYTIIGFVGTYNDARQLTYAYSIQETTDADYDNGDEPQEIPLGEAFTVGPEASTWVYSSTGSDLYLVVESDTDLVKEGKLVMNVGDKDILKDWEKITEEGKVIYAGRLENEVEATLVYSGETVVTMTLNEGTYVPEAVTNYIENLATPEQIVINPEEVAIEISWGTKVFFNDEDAVITVTNTDTDVKVGEITSEFMQIIPSGENEPSIMPTAELDDSGLTFAILTACGYFLEEGNYLLSIPEGLVRNAEGAINHEQSLFVEVKKLAEGTVTSDTEFAAEDEVVITIEFEDDVTIDESVENVALVYGDMEDEPLDKVLTWDDIVVNEKTLTINLGVLETGYYQFTLYDNVLTVDGVANAMVEANITVGDPSAINGINAADGKVEYYNLQGVKVNNPSNGIFIVNGKKVVIK